MTWAMRFADQPCMKCGRLLDPTDGVPVVDAEDKLLGFTCYPDCPEEEDAS